MADNQNQAPDFSDIPNLGDTQGLENYLNNQILAAQGVSTEQPAQQPAQPEQPQQPAQQQVQQQVPAQQPQQGVQASAQQGGEDTVTLTREQYAALLAAHQQRVQAQQQAQVQQRPQVTYTPQERQFVARALEQGYSLEQINNFLVGQRAKTQGDPVLAQRLNNVEQYLRQREYQAAQENFIGKLSAFGEKWGLSEQDLVTFGNAALQQGINIANDGVNFETVFRAVFPEQYAIRSRRMAPTNSSQIYGGTSMTESNRAQANKLEDAYVDAFLKGAMPNQYAALNKK